MINEIQAFSSYPENYLISRQDHVANPKAPLGPNNHRRRDLNFLDSDAIHKDTQAQKYLPLGVQEALF